VKRVCRDLIIYFGYSQQEGQENKSGFFDFDDLKEEEIQTFNGYKQLNKETKSWYIENKGELDTKVLDAYVPG
jgi:hypothetical protein